ncbi:MAG: hypothetical protein LBI62_01720, partial [Candidatus Accumulibacter sp.]|nr:hypothetical protein [Accumulibacter sp.]
MNDQGGGTRTMRRIMRGAVMVLLFLIVVGVGVTLWCPVCLPLATAVVFPEFAAKWLVNYQIAERARKIDLMKEQSPKNLESEVIRIEMEGRHYDVPIRYAYWQAFEKHGYWPKAKPERQKVGALSLSVLLPDMKPYYPEDDARWKVLGHGDRVQVTLSNSFSQITAWYSTLREKYFSGQDQFFTRQGEIHDMVLFASRGDMDDIYFPVDESIELKMSCSEGSKRPGFSPSCSVTSNYRPGIVLSYFYSKDYFSDWREIDLK